MTEGIPKAINHLDLTDYYRETHANRVYGTSSVKYIRFLRPEIKILQPQSILDYGCGQSRFLDCLELGYSFKKFRYDPAIPPYSKPLTQQVDLLVNIDVLEHIEEANLDNVLADMRRITRNAIIIIDTKPAKHTLPDGRNAHVTLRPHNWWRERLSRHFNYLEPIETPRRSRAGFRTWSRSPVQTLQYCAFRVQENSVYYGRRLIGRHKQDWKVSTTLPGE